MRLAWDVLRPGGTAVVVGLAARGVEVALPAIEFLSDKGIRGRTTATGIRVVELPELAELALSGELDLAGVVTHVEPLEAVEDALERLGRARACGPCSSSTPRGRHRVEVTLSDQERAACFFAYIADREDELVALVSDLIAFDTTARRASTTRRATRRPSRSTWRRGCARPEPRPTYGSRARGRCRQPDDAAGARFDGRPQLAARFRGAGGGRSLLFNGHIDVVTAEPRERWTSDPFRPEVRAGNLYGRGACDMKGGIASMVFAAEVLASLESGWRES